MPAEQLGRKVQRLDARVGADNHQPLDQGCVVRARFPATDTSQNRQRRLLNFCFRPRRRAELHQKMLHEAGNVLDAFAKGRHVEGK